MKTEIYRISEIMETLLAHQPVIDVPYEKINDIAIALVKEGYGNIKQAKIDVLNKVKSLAIYDDNYLDGYIFIDDVNELIKEMQAE